MTTGRVKAIATLATFTFLVFAAYSTVVAGPPVQKAPVGATIEMKPQTMRQPCDVSVSYIEYFNCPCDLDMDVYYVDSYLSVKVFNDSTLNPTVKLTVKYFDIPSNRVKTVIKNVNFTNRGGKKIIVLDRPLLIKKSYGVRAEVALTGPGLVDPDLSNNKKTQLLCGPVPE